ncbi:MAG: DNA repair protein RecN [Planctomycetes bacterium]|nr:DNA repair protein RecN [Planctomycetota bacterium]
MLVELSIQDVALLERAELEFGSGLNVITGETGAGKSLLIGALELLLGQRPKGKLVRQGADRALVEGRFSFAKGAAPLRLVRWLAEHEVEACEEEGELELVLSRSLGADGRTRAHLNRRPVTRTLLRELAGMLVEIHGQNDHQRLFEPAEQLVLLDAYGELDAPLEAYRAARSRWLGARAKLVDWEAHEAERRDRLDLLRFQVGELTDAGIDPEEIAGLRRERELLRHAEEVGKDVGGLLDRLSESDDSALDVLRRGERVLERWEVKLADLGEPTDSLREATAHLAAACDGLRDFLDGLDYSPRRLEEVEARLAEVERLERKYRASVIELAGLLPRLADELAELEEESEGFEGLERECGAARKALDACAKTLNDARCALVPGLVEEVQKALSELGLAKARVQIEFTPRAANAARPEDAYGESGTQRVEFQFAANPGEGFGPLRAVASGGEAARIMLALRGALAARQTIPALVFDEVDAGVGGRVGPKVGKHLAALGEHYQILCVTHLPAVAAAASRHLRVRKGEIDGRTRTVVEWLDAEDRVSEVADMISGGAAEKTALAEARRLLGVR